MDRSEVEKAVEILKNGGLIVYPTDTIWGIGCDAMNESAIERIYKLKGRDTAKSMIVLLSKVDQLSYYVNKIPAITFELLDESKKPLTIIYDGAKNLPANVIANNGTIAIRIVKDPFCMEIIEHLNRPLISTSANISGKDSPHLFYDIDPQVLQGVDYVVNLRREENVVSAPSRIIRIDNKGIITVIRE